VDTFAFNHHLIDPKKGQSQNSFLGKEFFQNSNKFLSTFFPPIYLSEIPRVTSAATTLQVCGGLIACPLAAERMLELPEKIVNYKIAQTGRFA